MLLVYNKTLIFLLIRACVRSFLPITISSTIMPFTTLSYLLVHCIGDKSRTIYTFSGLVKTVGRIGPDTTVGTRSVGAPTIFGVPGRQRRLQ